MSSEREKPVNDDCSVPEKLRKQNRRLDDNEIRENLMNESDDNCSDFDDDVGDPDYTYESEHDTEFEQSDEDDVEVAYPHIEEVYHGEISLNHENEEQEREERTDRSQEIREQSEEETMVREEQHGAAETRIGEIGEQYSEVETRNDQGSEDLRTEQEPNEESTGELPRYFYGKNRYKWASAKPSRTSRVRTHNIVNVPSQVSPSEFKSITELWKLIFTDHMIEMVVNHTNKKLDSYRAKYKDTSRSELGSTNETEIKAFFVYFIHQYSNQITKM